MRLTRVYYGSPLSAEQTLDLPDDIIRHISNALRAKVGDKIILFNGDGYDYPATIEHISKKQLSVLVTDKINNVTAPVLNIHLAQCICRGEKMDFVIQKATELGVTQITPVISEFGNVTLKPDRWPKKISHWQKVANSACEQSGRADLVMVNCPVKFMDFVKHDFLGTKLILSPEANSPLETVSEPDTITLLVGPEGGFSQSEVNDAIKNDFLPWQLGPRILRSETAGLAAITMVQNKWGDF